jgi:hypothetical protein
VSDLDLSAALRPLWRSYLRRLDEMAARVPEASLLREAITRDPLGQPRLGRDGLLLCFDVADALSGETFEVRGAAPDAPAAEGGRWGALDVQLLPGNWEALPLCCALEGAPRDAELLALAELIRSWAVVASHGGFALSGAERAAPWSGRVHSLRVVVEGATLTAVLDLGTCPPAALGVLLSALDGFSRDAHAIARVSLGGRADEPQDQPI